MASTEMTRPGRAVWIALASLALLQATISLHDAWDLHTNFNYDTASYYVVARNFAVGRGLVDTNLWHYLGSQPVPHPAGDYWPAGWPVVLGLLLRVFGHSERAAILVSAGLSTLLPVGVFWLTRVVRRSGDVKVPLVAGLLVVLQGRLYQTNVTTDVTMPYALCVLGSLIGAFRLSDGPADDARRHRVRDLLAGLVLTAPIWFRAEAFFLPLAFAPPILWPSRSPGPFRGRLRRFGWLALGVVLGQALMAMFNLVAFGRPVPPSRSFMPWITTYGDLYTFLTDPSRATWWAQGLHTILARSRATVTGQFSALFKQLPWMLPTSAAIGAGVAAWRRDTRAFPIVLFVLFTCSTTGILAPLLTSPDRTVMNATPALCLLSALAVAPLIDRARRWASHIAVGTATAAWGFLCCTLLWPAHIRLGGGTNWAPFLRAPADLTDPATLASLDLHPTDVVLSNDPWQLAAVLDVRTVMWPLDGAPAVRAVIARYEPRYVLTRRGEAVPVPAHVKARVGRSVWYEIDR